MDVIQVGKIFFVFLYALCITLLVYIPIKIRKLEKDRNYTVCKYCSHKELTSDILEQPKHDRKWYTEFGYPLGYSCEKCYIRNKLQARKES